MEISRPCFFGTKEIKQQLLRVLDKQEWKHRRVLDFPVGSGFTAGELVRRGADVVAWDMFPEFLKVEGLTCKLADLQSKFPAGDGEFDCAIFQDGIEHVPNQLFALQEFSRVLKDNGCLILTTPNYSNLRSRLSYLSFEAETPKMMPPNEVESIWFGGDSRIYYGHIFSIGIMRLRVLARLAGLEINKIHSARVNWSSILLGILFYIPIVLHTWKCYLRAIRINKGAGPGTSTRRVFRDLVSLGTHPNILFTGHFLIEFKKSNFSPTPRDTEVFET
jgi:SAM-dependent methyltransferase